MIKIALEEADNHVAKYYKGNEKPVISTKRTLSLLLEEVITHPENINERVLRAMHDIGAVLVKQFELYPLDDAIGNVTKMLYYGLPHYKNLAILGADFGKGNPI